MEMQVHRAFTGVALLTSVASLAVAQKSSIISVRSGASKSISGNVKGRGYVDYKLSLGAGQSLSVALLSKSSSVYFNVIPPKQTAAMYIGNMGTNQMDHRIVPMEGEHVIRVYQMGAAADGGKTNSYALHVKVAGSALAPLKSSVDARLKGTPYHASAPIDCRIDLEPRRKTCEGYVIRRGNGSATVEFRYGSAIRRVLFVNGKPVAHDSPFAFTYEKSGDITTLRFGDRPDEEFKVIDAMVFGG